MNDNKINLTFSDLFRDIALKIKDEADNSIKELGLNSKQGRMISYIYEHKQDGVIQKDLASAFSKKNSTITSMLQGLEKGGYIERRIPSDNERQKNVYVLPKGEKLVDDFNHSFSKVEEKLLSSLAPEEIENLEKLLLKIKSTL